MAAINVAVPGRPVQKTGRIVAGGASGTLQHPFCTFQGSSGNAETLIAALLHPNYRYSMVCEHILSASA